MNKHWKYWFGFTLVMLGAIAGCNRQDADHLTRIGRKILSKIESGTGETQSHLNHSLQAVHLSWNQATLEARIAARLRWDKQLVNAHIQVCTSGNTVELKGKIKESSQRRRAVELAESTVGVEKVREQLIVDGE